MTNEISANKLKSLAAAKLERQVCRRPSYIAIGARAPGFTSFRRPEELAHPSKLNATIRPRRDWTGDAPATIQRTNQIAPERYESIPANRAASLRLCTYTGEHAIAG